jgi:hypothetical protein
LRVPYRTYPGPKGTVLYYPFVRIRIGRRHGPKTRFFEALVDSGAEDCIFPAQLATTIGLDLRAGRQERRIGIGGVQSVWVHPIVLYMGEHALPIEAAFVETLPMSGLLGRIGFFEHFKITFDPTSDPPGLELERVLKT